MTTGYAVRRLAALVALLVACVLPFGSAQAADDIRPKDNVATAINEVDGTSVSDFAWEVRKQTDGVVDHLNSARAAARCVGCRATAIAFQVVLVSGSPTTNSPRNLAVAINDQCTECVVVAEARQFVRVVDAPVKITDAGRDVLADVREQLRALEAQNLDVAALHAAVETQEARVREVLNNEVVLKAEPDSAPEVLDKQLFQSSDLG